MAAKGKKSTQRKLTAMLSADVAGYSRLMGDALPVEKASNCWNPGSTIEGVLLDRKPAELRSMSQMRF